MNADVRFVGREEERRTFQRLLDNPYGEERLMFIWGPGGIGKTWLARALLDDARARQFRVADIIDTYSTETRHVEGIIEAIIKHLRLPEIAFANYREERAKLNAARQQEGYAQAGIEAQLSALAAAFRHDLQRVVQERPVVVAFDTFEHVQDKPVGRWILSEDGLQMPGLLCIVAGRKPNPFDPGKPPLGGLSDNEAFHFYNLYIPPLFGERGPEDKEFVAHLNKLVAGNPLLLGLALLFLDTTGLSEGEWQELAPAEFERRLVSWLSPANISFGSLFPVYADEALTESLRQTLVCMAYLNRRFNRHLLEQLVQAGYVRGATVEQLWETLTGDNLPGFFYVKGRPEGEIQLHDKLAEMLRLTVLPDAFDDPTGLRVRQFADDIVAWYDDLIIVATNDQQRAILQVEKLAYAMRLDVLTDIQQLEWQDTPEAQRLAHLLPPDFEKAKELITEFQRQYSDVLNRLVVNEIRPDVAIGFPQANRYEVCATLGDIARNAYLLEESTQYWRCALAVAQTVEQQILALEGESNSTWQLNPQTALDLLKSALDYCNQAPHMQPTILYRIAFVYRQMQDLENAAIWYEKARQSAQLHDKKGRTTAKILNDMGYVLLLIGKLGEAEAHINLAAVLRERLKDKLQVQADDLRSQLTEAKDVETRERLAMELAIADAQLREATLKLGMTYNTLGQLARQNPSNMSEATNYYSEALSIFNRLNDYYWQAHALQARGEAHRRLSLSLYYKERLESSARYDSVAAQDIHTSLELCERYGFVDMMAIVRRRMGRLLHDRALKSSGNPQRQIQLMKEALSFFEAGIQAAEISRQTIEELENSVEIAFLTDDLIRAYRQLHATGHISEADLTEVKSYLGQLERRIVTHQDDDPQIYQFPVFKDLLEIERGAYYYELGDYEKSLQHYLHGFTELASDPGYGSARCQAHIDHLFNNIDKLDDDQLKQEWCSRFIAMWQSTTLKRGESKSIASRYPKLMAQFKLHTIVDNEPRIMVANDIDDRVIRSGGGPDCDCACSEDGFSLSLVDTITNAMLQQAGVFVHSLSLMHKLMFNPLRDQGVVVVNRPAKEIWDSFATPQPSAINNEFALVVDKMVRAGLLEPVGASVKTHRGKPRTLSAWLHITNECNLRCDYCYVSKTAESMSPETGFAAIDAIIRSAKRGNFKRIKLKFAGGEATLNLKLVFAMHHYAVEQAAAASLEMESVILSNGVALGEKAIAELEQRGIRVMISLDGVGETHDAQRRFKNGRGSFAWTSRTLDRLIAQGIKPFISITVTDRNVDGLPEVVSYVLERGLPFNLNFFRDNECAASFDDLQMQDDRLIEAMFRVFDVIEANLPDHSLLGSLIDRSQFDQPHDKTCGVGESYLVVDHYGHVAKCHMEIEKPVTDVYVDDPLALIRADQIGIQNISVEEKEGCRECEWKYWCTGGCPLLTYKATGRFDVKSPYCRVYKAIYPRLLRLEGLRLLKLNGILC